MSEGGGKPLMFVAKPPHFFKMILEDSLRQGKLMLPEKFVKNYGKDLQNLARLKLLCKVWPIELTKSHGKVWLQKGSKEFAEYYSVACGHFLVFEYEGNGGFHVLIFDNSATDIDYLLSNRHSEESGRGLLEECKKEGVEENSSVEILGHLSPSQRTRKKSPLPCLQPHKMVRTYSTYEAGTGSKLNTLEVVPPIGTRSRGMKLESFRRTAKSDCSVRGLDDSIRGGRGMIMATGQRLSHSGAIANMRPLTRYEKAKALQRTSAFKSENPFFKVTMNPSYVRTGNRLTVPTSFARKYFTKNHGNATLCVTDGRTWPVKYYNYQKFGVLFSHGWRAFSEENKLDVGDVCMFELINITEMSFKVAYFRLKDVKSHQSSDDKEGSANQVEPNKSSVPEPQSAWNGEDGAVISIPDDEHKPEELEHSGSRFKFEPGKFGKSELINSSAVPVLDTQGSETESKFIPTHPFFEVVLRSYYLRKCFLPVPISFFERYFTQKNQTVMLQAADRSWPVKLIIYFSRRKATLSAGWARYARDNSLRVGDVCAFQMIKSGVIPKNFT